MRLYSLVDADSHVTSDGTRITPDEAGGFDFDDDMAETVGSFAVKGKKLWETEGERVERLHGMEMARRRDPASMLTVMEQNAALTSRLAAVMEQLAALQIGPAPAGPPAGPEAPAEAPAGPEADAGSQAAPEPAPAKAARTPRAAAKTAS